MGKCWTPECVHTTAPDLLIHCVITGGTGAQWAWATHTELWATEVSVIAPIIQQGAAASKIWCCRHNHLLDSSVGTDEPLDCLHKRGIRGRHWSVFLKEEKKRAERKHWSKNPDVCGSTSLLLLPGYFHPVRVTWTPRTMTFSCALSENDWIISQRGFSFHFDHDNLSQYMVLQ